MRTGERALDAGWVAAGNRRQPLMGGPLGAEALQGVEDMDVEPSQVAGSVGALDRV